MLVLSITGASDTGKTRLITSLIKELTKRGYRVGCIKHCPEGFELDHPGKDSHRFRKEGAWGVVVYSPGQIGVIKTTDEQVQPGDLAIDHLSGCDFVLAEGFKNAKKIRKFELLRKGIDEESKTEDAVAIISDFELNTDKPVLHPDEPGRIVDFLEILTKEENGVVRLQINDKNIPLNPFLKTTLKNTILGLVSSLKKKEGVTKRIDIKLEV